MDDFYTEQLIKKQADSKDTLKKVGLIALTVVSVLLVFVMPVGIILPVVMIASNKGEVCKVLFEPNETIVEGFFVKAPRKVIRK